jgi:hypothetical protein
MKLKTRALRTAQMMAEAPRASSTVVSACPGLGLPGWWKISPAELCLAGDGAETLLDDQVHVRVQVLVDGVEGDERVEHEDVGPYVFDEVGQGLEHWPIENRTFASQCCEPQRLVAHGLDEQAAAKVGLGDVIAQADGGDAAVEFVLILLGVQDQDAQWTPRQRLAGGEIARRSHLEGFKQRVAGLEAAAGSDGGANVPADVVFAVEELAPRDGRRVAPPGIAFEVWRLLNAGRPIDEIDDGVVGHLRAPSCWRNALRAVCSAS